MSTGKLVGIAAGIAVGAAIGMLYAPGKGSEFRRKVTKAGLDYADDMIEKFDHFVGEMREKLEEAVNSSDRQAGTADESDMQAQSNPGA